MQARPMQHKIPQIHCQMEQAPLLFQTVNFSIWKTGIINQNLLERFQWIIVFVFGGVCLFSDHMSLGSGYENMMVVPSAGSPVLGCTPWLICWLFLSVFLGHHFPICCTLNLALTGTGFPYEPDDRFPCGPRVRRLPEKFLWKFLWSRNADTVYM